ncbi:hypothetical protein CU098_001492 [Rhizopus stolonifer]|uniref:non-specific serine/threonine protein kinase n=1 Tax=Rhizopus stolonifer TaxID=4846 RepID=A0A367KYQ6_RHIST|nr:hypothetical protein CU098_001492 [Rhizopus stolonifer]
MIQVTTKTKQFPKRPTQIKQNKLGPYNLLQTLGEGEFGKVKLGIHSETGEEVAIKLIRKDGAGSDSRINKVEREISILKHLNHPYIVKLYDVVETEKYVGLVLEYASGGELFEYILAHRYLKERDAKKFFAQLISSVQYMHKCKIVHRDLKLENVLIDKNRNIIVTDFGFANQFSTAADDMMSTTCGSPCYAAPELVVNAGLYAGSAVDIWSCGVILFAMLCGYLPFDDDPSNPDSDDINQLYRYIISTRLIFPSHVSLQARDLLEKMLVPDPAKRCTLDFVTRHVWLEDVRDFLSREHKIERSQSTRKTHLSEKSDRFAPVTNNSFVKTDEWIFNEPVQANKPMRHSSMRSSKIPSFITRKPIKEIRSPPTIPEVTTSTENQPEKSVSTSFLSTDPPKEKFLGLFSKSHAKEEVDYSETSTIGNSSLISPCLTEESLATKSIFSRLAEKSSQPSSFTESGITTSSRSSFKDNTPHRTATISHRPTSSVRQEPMFANSSTSLASSGSQPSPEPTQSSRFNLSAVRRSIYRRTKTPTTEPSKPLTHFVKEPTKSQRWTMDKPVPKVQENKVENKKKGKKVMDWIKKKSKPHEVSVKKDKEEDEGEEEEEEEEAALKQENHKEKRIEPVDISEAEPASRGRTLSNNNMFTSKKEDVDTRIQIHSGPIDRAALTSRPPQKIIKEVTRILHILGIESQSDREDGPFVLKCTRRKASKRKEEGLQPIYGEPAIDNGEEIRFVVEMCRFKNLPGLFIVDVKRLKGNVWAYKFLYHKLIDFLDLNKDDYL